MSHISSERPLSPHLQVYRPQISSVLSISHRATGLALWLGSFFLVAWLWTVAYDAAYFNCLRDIMAHPVSKVILIGWTFALFYHLGNGIRHLFWDAGYGFELHNMTRSGIMVILFAIAATTAMWVMIFQQVSFIPEA